MNLVARQDRVLLGGLAVALIVVFARPIRFLLDLARDVERSSGLALMPALIILTVVFFFHQQGKRQEAKAHAAAAEADALQAGARATEMERLVNFGQALGRSLYLDTIRDVVAQQLPKLAGTEDAWVLLRAAGKWQALVGTARETRRDIEVAREQLIEQALIGDAAWASDAIMPTVTCTADDRGRPPGRRARRALRRLVRSRQRGGACSRSAALLAISIRNAQLFHDVRENSLRDGLTGCFNRTHALDAIGTSCAAPGDRRRRCRSSCSISIASRPSTIATATCAAIRCWRWWAPGCAGCCAAATKCRPAARNSWCSCRRRRSKGRSGSRTRCVARLRTCRSTGRAK
jgi:hypothetical protein